VSMLNLGHSSDELGSICLSTIGAVDLSIIVDHKTIVAIDARLGTC